MKCKICEEAELDADDCPCPNDEDHHCEVCAHLVCLDGYCNHCDAFAQATTNSEQRDHAQMSETKL